MLTLHDGLVVEYKLTSEQVLVKTL